MAEIDELVRKYGIQEIAFEDDQFIAKVKHIEELLDALIAPDTISSGIRRMGSRLGGDVLNFL